MNNTSLSTFYNVIAESHESGEMFPVKKLSDHAPHSLGIVEHFRVPYTAELDDNNAGLLR